MPNLMNFKTLAFLPVVAIAAVMTLALPGCGDTANPSGEAGHTDEHMDSDQHDQPATDKAEDGHADHDH